MYSIQALNKKIFCGHTLDELKKFPDESIDCVITSPPYWALRDYDTTHQIWDEDKSCEHTWGKDLKVQQSGGSDKFTTGGAPSKGLWFENHSNFCLKCNAWKGSLGLEPNFKLYIQHLLQIFGEVKRVLKKTGTCWVNIGDSYSASGGSGNNQTVHTQFGKVQKINKYSAGTIPHVSKDLPPKCLCQIPERFAIGMTDNGWIKRNTIIWQKPNCMPSSVKDRFTVDFEYFYFFTKNPKYYFEQQFKKYSGSMNRWGGQELKADGQSTWDEGTGQLSYRQRNLRPNSKGRNKRTVWLINTTIYKEAHFAVFPEELVTIPIKSGCPKGGIVLDPFAGSGTTLLVAEKLDRQWVGIELSSKYVELIHKRIDPILKLCKLF